MLMHRFYGELLDEGSNQSPAEALRAAQLHVRSQPGFEHPYFWAPFAVYSPAIDRDGR
jgi:CHAT domain-containing protein